MLYIANLPPHKQLSSPAEKDESHIVIYIDFKTDLIDLFKGNKEAKKRLEAVNLIREFPGNLMGWKF